MHPLLGRRPRKESTDEVEKAGELLSCPYWHAAVLALGLSLIRVVHAGDARRLSHSADEAQGQAQEELDSVARHVHRNNTSPPGDDSRPEALHLEQ